MNKPYQFTPVPEPVKRDPLHGDTYEHPSFGVIQASRFTGGGRRPMFGSKILHDGSGRVAVEIKGADYGRGLHNDWIHGKSGDTIVRVEMTESQWASFISSPNQQSVPCTITARRDGKFVSVEDPPFFEIIDQFSMELHEKMARLKEDSKQIAVMLETLIDGKGAPKADLKAIRTKVLTTLEYLPGNLDFMKRQFEEAMESTVEEAKLEIETHISRTLANLGLEGAQQFLGLPERQNALPPAETDPSAE
jgi:hypothetical protein